MEIKRVLLNKKTLAYLLLVVVLVTGLYLWQQWERYAHLNFAPWQLKSACQEVFTSAGKQPPQDALAALRAEHDELSVYHKFLLAENDKQGWYSLPELLEAHPTQAEIFYANKASFVKKYTSGELQLRLTALGKGIAQLEYIDAYPAYLDSIFEQAAKLQGSGIFSNPESFTYKNIAKTAAAYRPFADVTLSPAAEDSITTVLEFTPALYAAVLFALLLVWQLTVERKYGMWQLVYATPNGRRRLALSRLGILFAAVVLFVAVLYAALLACSFSLYGGADALFRPVQSISLFQNFTLSMTAFEFLGFYLAALMLCLFVLALFFWLLVSLFANRSIALGAAAFALGIAYFLYAVIPVQSNLVLLKVCNLVSLINPLEILLRYRNLHLFSAAVARRNIFFVFVAALGLLLGFVCVLYNARKKPVSSPRKIELVLIRLFDKAAVVWHRFTERLGTTAMELYKLLILQKGVVIAAVLVCLLVVTMETDQIYYGETGYMLNSFYEEYSGPVTKETLDYLDALAQETAQVEKNYLHAAEGYAMGEISQEAFEAAGLRMRSYESKFELLDILEDRLAYIDAAKTACGESVWLVNPNGYDALWGEEGRIMHQVSAVGSLLCVVLLLSGVFAFEKKTKAQILLRSKSLGRGYLLRRKLLAAGILTTFVWLTVSSAELYPVWFNYAIDCFAAPLTSLPLALEFGKGFTIGGFLITLYGMRLVILLCAAAVVCCLSALCSYEATLAISTALLALPSIASLLGMEWTRYFALSEPIVALTLLLRKGWGIQLAATAIALGIAVVALGITANTWCITGRKGKQHATHHTKRYQNIR